MEYLTRKWECFGNRVEILEDEEMFLEREKTALLLLLLLLSVFVFVTGFREILRFSWVLSVFKLALDAQLTPRNEEYLKKYVMCSLNSTMWSSFHILKVFRKSKSIPNIT